MGEFDSAVLAFDRLQLDKPSDPTIAAARARAESARRSLLIGMTHHAAGDHVLALHHLSEALQVWWDEVGNRIGSGE